MSRARLQTPAQSLELARDLEAPVPRAQSRPIMPRSAPRNNQLPVFAQALPQNLDAYPGGRDRTGRPPNRNPLSDTSYRNEGNDDTRLRVPRTRQRSRTPPGRHPVPAHETLPSHSLPSAPSSSIRPVASASRTGFVVESSHARPPLMRSTVQSSSAQILPPPQRSLSSTRPTLTASTSGSRLESTRIEGISAPSGRTGLLAPPVLPSRPPTSSVSRSVVPTRLTQTLEPSHSASPSVGPAVAPAPTSRDSPLTLQDVQNERTGGSHLVLDHPHGYPAPPPFRTS